ncbi:hypothetical protein SynA1544_02029 [Synechococcus sp. A15-44]|nr:hypothetical protein SynA1544_02029 [Synechococcus sp. A15-44]
MMCFWFGEEMLNTSEDNPTTHKANDRYSYKDRPPSAG